MRIMRSWESRTFGRGRTMSPGSSAREGASIGILHTASTHPTMVATVHLGFVSSRTVHVRCCGRNQCAMVAFLRRPRCCTGLCCEQDNDCTTRMRQKRQSAILLYCCQFIYSFKVQTARVNKSIAYASYGRHHRTNERTEPHDIETDDGSDRAPSTILSSDIYTVHVSLLVSHPPGESCCRRPTCVTQTKCGFCGVSTSDMCVRTLRYITVHHVTPSGTKQIES